MEKPSRLQKAAGFRQLLNWKLYLALSIPWALFCLLRLPMLFPSIFCGPKADTRPFHAAPGECYWYTHARLTRYGAGMALHLAGAVPAGLLAPLQFTPRLRRRHPRLHRAAGYASTAGVLAGNVGVLLLLDRAFGGELATQSVGLALAAMTTFALVRGVQHARSRRVADHRAWMLRAWAYLGAILTMRPLLGVAALAMSLIPSAEQWRAVSCAEVAFITAEEHAGNASALLATRQRWPGCDPTSAFYDASAMVPVRASVLDHDPVQRTVALRAAFGPMAWVALMAHALAVEFYLNYTATKTTVTATTSSQRGGPLVTDSTISKEKLVLEASTDVSS